MTASSLNTCRLCTRHSEEMTSIFNPESLAIRIMWVSQLKISPGDGLPDQICQHCSVCVDTAYQFKELCWTSEEELRKLASLPVSDYLSKRPMSSGETSQRLLNGNTVDSGNDVDFSTVEVKVEIVDSGNQLDSIDTYDLPEVVETEIVETTPYEEPRTHFCDACGVSLKKRPTASKTEANNDAQLDVPVPTSDSYCCAICHGTYTTEDAFITHIGLHDRRTMDHDDDAHRPSTEHVYSCAICGAAFRHQEAFLSHIRQYHSRRKRKSSERQPSGRPGFHCAICGASFEREEAFTMHFQRHTTDMEVMGQEEEEEAPVYSCAICHASYESKLSFIAHIKLHTMEKRYECPEDGCRKRFASHSDLTRHYRCHTGEKPFRCVVCDKSFARQDHLSKHGRTHTGFKPYTCGECNVSFAEKKSLVSHLRSHRGVKPYECGACSKSFARLENYSAHARTHSGVKPFKCILCSKSFIEKRGLQRHVKTSHGRVRRGN